MKIKDVTYDIDLAIEHSGRFVLESFNNHLLTEQKLEKDNFEKVLVQINTIIQQKLKEIAAKKKKAPSLAMLSNVLRQFNFQPSEIENILVRSGIDAAAAKKVTTPAVATAKKSRKNATAPAAATDPTQEMKQIVNDLTKIGYQTPAIKNKMEGIQRELLAKIDAGITKDDLIDRITNELDAIKSRSVTETTSGATAAGNIAGLANPGGAMMPLIKRMPAGQSFFAPAAVSRPKRSKKKAKKR